MFEKRDLFRLCPPPPELSGRILFSPPDARAIFLYNDLLCNGTCFVTGGRITYWGGGTNEKDPKKDSKLLKSNSPTTPKK